MDLYTTGVRKLIDEYLLEKAKEKRDYGDYWSASSAGYCMRKVIFDRMGVPEVKPDARKQRVFEAGHVFHEWIQRITRDAGLSIASEVELIDDKIMVKGHFDDLILIDEITEGMVRNQLKDFEISDLEVHSAKKLILYDYKTANSRSFSYKRELSQYHRMQLGTYMYMLRNASPITLFKGHNTKDLTEARTLIIEKDNLMTKEFQLFWDSKLEKDVYSYWSTLNGYWKKRTMPKCTCADYEGGFMARPNYNPYFYNDQPCSLEWFIKCKEEGLLNDIKEPQTTN